jgi:hypothetical protein
VRQSCGDPVNVGSPGDEQVHVADRQIDPLQAARTDSYQAVREPWSGRCDEVEAFAQHRFQVTSVA